MPKKKTTSVSKAPKGCHACKITGMLVFGLLMLTTLASLLGVYKSHFISTGTQFGSTSGSLALIAFAINVTFLIKTMAKCCPCNACDVK